jgi:acyl-CoA synthetase (AMP-forming)/AMP-acid ligase II
MDTAVFVAGLNGMRKRWLRTGDLGFVADGELIVAGRAKDLIIVHGRKLHPQDLEFTVATSSADTTVNAVAAFALAGDASEGVGICVEVAHAGERTQPNVTAQLWQALADRIRDALYRQHEIAIASLAFVHPGALARTSSGKLMRYRCRDDYVHGRMPLYARFDAPAAALIRLTQAA